MPEQARATTTAAEVEQFLRENPDFLVQHPQLLQELQLSHEAGGAASLIEKQVEVLRKDREELQSKLLAMQEEAAANEVLLGGMNNLIRELIPLESPQALLEKLETSLKSVFGLETVLLCVEPTAAQPCSGWPATRLLDKEGGAAVSSEVYDLKTYVGRVPSRLAEHLKLGEEDRVASVALLKLPLDQPAFLLLGHSDERRFESHMATDFVEHLAAVLAALLERHL